MRTTFIKEDLICYIDSYINRYVYYDENDTAFVDSIKTELTENAESANWMTDNILQDRINAIDNYDIRNFYRRFLIASKYNYAVNHRCARSRQPYISRVNNDWITVCYETDCIANGMVIPKTTTRLLSPDGSILLKEGSVYLFDNIVACNFACASDVRSGDRGIYDLEKGMPIIPCVLDHVHVDDFLFWIEFQYKDYPFLINLRLASMLDESTEFDDSHLCFNIKLEQHRFPYLVVEEGKDDMVYYHGIGRSRSEPLDKEAHMRIMEDLKDFVSQFHETYWGDPKLL